LAEVSAAPYGADGCQPGKFQKDGEDCTKYSVCDNGDFHVRACPAGLHWNGISACTWPRDSGCNLGGGASQEEEEEDWNVVGDGEEKALLACNQSLKL